MRKIYLDACIVIYLIEKHLVFSGKIENLIFSLTNYELCFSPLVEMECLVMPFRTQDAPLKKLYENFFDAQTRLSMPSEIFQKAAQLRADFPALKTPDALHLSTALYHNCDEFWTNDNRLNKIAPNLVKKIL